MKYCLKLFIEQVYYQGKFFKILKGKPIEENIKKIKYFFYGSPYIKF